MYLHFRHAVCDTVKMITTLSETVAALLLLHLCGCGSVNNYKLGKL